MIFILQKDSMGQNQQQLVITLSHETFQRTAKKAHLRIKS